MSARGFKSVVMAGSVAVAALGCYMISLNVASERAALEGVERKILLAQRDIRVLQTEIGTRGRLAQLERWNAGFIQLSAPSADQIVADSFQLATLAAPEKRQAIDAPVVYAAAEAPPPRITSDDEEVVQPVARAAPASPDQMMHVASYSRPETVAPAPAVTTAKPAPVKVAEPKKAGAGTLEANKVEAKKGEPNKAEPKKAEAKAVAAKPASKPVDAKAKPALAARPATKAVKSAAADPLAPLPKAAATAKASSKTRTP